MTENQYLECSGSSGWVGGVTVVLETRILFYQPPASPL